MKAWAITRTDASVSREFSLAPPGVTDRRTTRSSCRYTVSCRQASVLHRDDVGTGRNTAAALVNQMCWRASCEHHFEFATQFVGRLEQAVPHVERERSVQAPGIARQRIDRLHVATVTLVGTGVEDARCAGSVIAASVSSAFNSMPVRTGWLVVAACCRGVVSIAPSFAMCAYRRRGPTPPVSSQRSIIQSRPAYMALPPS